MRMWVSCLPSSAFCAECWAVGGLAKESGIQGAGPRGGVRGGVVLGAGSIRRLALLKDPAALEVRQLWSLLVPSLLPTPVHMTPHRSWTFSTHDPGAHRDSRPLASSQALRGPAGSSVRPARPVTQTSLARGERAHTARPLHSAWTVPSTVRGSSA